MSHSSGDSVPDLTMTPPKWVTDKAEQEKQQKPEKPDEHEVTSAKTKSIRYRIEKDMDEWEDFYILSLTDSDRVLDLKKEIAKQQGKVPYVFHLYLNAESIENDESRTIGSLNLGEKDSLVFRFGDYKEPPKRKERDEEEEKVFDKKRRKEQMQEMP